MSWLSLLPAEGRAALRRPTTAVSAVWFLLSGFLFALSEGGVEDGFNPARPLVGTALFAFMTGIVYGVIPGILLGTAVGGEDHDLETKRDLRLSKVPQLSRFIAKVVIAVDLTVALSLLILLGAGLVGLWNLLFRGGAFFGEAYEGQASFLGYGLGMVVLVLPFTACASACTAAILRSRFWGAVVWLAIFVLYYMGYLASVWSPSLVYLVKFLPLGGVVALVSGEAWPGDSSTYVRPWVALAICVMWLAVLAFGAAYREHTWGVSSGGHRRAAKVEPARDTLGMRGRVVRSRRKVRWRRHIVAAVCLPLGLGLAGLLSVGGLVQAGVSHDPIFRTITHNTQRDYLRHLAGLLAAEDYDEASRYVGQGGHAGLTAIREEIEARGSDYRLGIGSQGSDDRSYGALYVEKTITDAGGAPIVVSEAFLLDMRFEAGTWIVLSIQSERKTKGP